MPSEARPSARSYLQFLDPNQLCPDLLAPLEHLDLKDLPAHPAQMDKMEIQDSLEQRVPRERTE